MSTFNTHGGFFAPQDYFRVDTGGSHEENPNGGVQVGVDPQGVPNVLEEGEPVYNDYVYSDNIKAEADILKQFHLPEKFAGKLYSEIADLFVDEAEERPLDPTSNNGLNAMLVRLANAQDEQKRREQEAELEAELAKLSPEELDQLDAMLAEQMQSAPAEQQVDPMQEQAMQEQMAAEQGMVPAQAAVPQEQMMPAGQEMIPMAYGGFIKRYEPGGDLEEPIQENYIGDILAQLNASNEQRLANERAIAEYNRLSKKESRLENRLGRIRRRRENTRAAMNTLLSYYNDLMEKNPEEQVLTRPLVQQQARVNYYNHRFDKVLDKLNRTRSAVVDAEAALSNSQASNYTLPAAVIDSTAAAPALRSNTSFDEDDLLFARGGFMNKFSGHDRSKIRRITAPYPDTDYTGSRYNFQIYGEEPVYTVPPIAGVMQTAMSYNNPGGLDIRTYPGMMMGSYDGTTTGTTGTTGTQASSSYILPEYSSSGTPLTRVQQYTSLPQGMPSPFAGYRVGDMTAAYRSTSPLYTLPAYTPPSDTLHSGPLVGVTPTTVPTELYTMDGIPLSLRFKSFLDHAGRVTFSGTRPGKPEDGKTAPKTAATTDNTILPAPLSTAGQYVGPGMAAALALHNFAQSPDRYSIPTYNPVLPNGRLSLVSPRYMPIDVNQTVNDILASNAGALRSIQQSGYGAVMPGAMIAADYTAGRALGTGRVNTRMANNQMRNDVIGQVNNNATAMANFDLGINNARAGILNPYMRQQAQDALALQQLNYGGEGERYAAIQQMLDSIADYAAKDARQKQYLNQINSNTALPYVVGQDAYARYTGKNGGKLKKK